MNEMDELKAHILTFLLKMICNPGMSSIFNNKFNCAKRHFLSDPRTMHLLLGNRLRSSYNAYVN